MAKRQAATEKEAPPQNLQFTNAPAPVPMPLYRSHKIVAALKIKSIGYKSAPDGADNYKPDDIAGVLEFEEEGYAPKEVTFAYLNKHNPQLGGYFVMYEDGYQSWSPAAAFKGGYTYIGKSVDAQGVGELERQATGNTNAAPIEVSALNIEDLVKLAHGLRQNSLYGWTGLTGEERFWKALGIAKPY